MGVITQYFANVNMAYASFLERSLGVCAGHKVFMVVDLNFADC